MGSRRHELQCQINYKRTEAWRHQGAIRRLIREIVDLEHELEGIGVKKNELEANKDT